MQFQAVLANFFAVSRYSDACDYVMTCMYEERSEIYAGKPYWFRSATGDILFYLSRDPIPTTDVSEGFCFPDIGTMSDDERSAMKSRCKGREYFAAIQAYFLQEFFMFIRADPATSGEAGYNNWFPHKVQFELKYWQTTLNNVKEAVSQAEKPEEKVEGPWT